MPFEPTTLLFETVNFVVLVLVLWRILYRPLRAGIEARRGALMEEREAVSIARHEAEAKEAAWVAREGELEELRRETRRVAIEEAALERAALLERAREDARAERARAEKLLETERAAASRWVEAAIWERGSELAGRMLLAIAPEAVDEALADRLLEVIVAHREELRSRAQATENLDVEVCGATMAAADWVARLRGELSESLGQHPRIRVSEDESLIGGWTVQVGDRLFDASIAGQLAAFRDLARSLSPEER